MFIGTDGVQNSYWNIEQLHGFYRGLALTFAEYGMTEGEQQLADFLPEMTRKGSGDDVSVAGVVDLEALKAADSALKNAVNYIAADNALEEPIPEESADDNG